MIQDKADTAPGATASASALAAQRSKLQRLEPALARMNVAEHCDRYSESVRQ